MAEKNESSAPTAICQLPSAISAWDRFWFRPADPTGLGVIRAVTGFLVLYVVLAYTPDLNTFFGAGAWFDRDITDKYRYGSPHPVASGGWDDLMDFIPNVRLPASDEGRADVLAFLRKAGEVPKAKRFEAIWYPTHLPGDPDDILRGFTFVQRLPADPKERDAALDALVNLPDDAKVRDEKVPPFLQALPEADRKRMRQAAVDFLALLPDTADGRDNVINHLAAFYREPSLLNKRVQGGRNDTARKRFELFVLGLPDDAGEREALLGYLEDWGYDPNQLYARGSYAASLWYHVYHPAAMWFMHAGIVVSVLLFAVGFCTRVTSVVAWVGVVSYTQRGQAAYVYGQDTMLNILMIYLIIGPSGAAFSVDRLIRRYLDARKAAREGRALEPDAGPAPSVMANFASRLIQVHFCFIYLASATSKLKGNAWWDNTSVWGVLANPEFTPLIYGWYDALLRALCESRPLWHAVMSLSVVFTLVTEFGLPVLVWTRLRPVMLTLSALLHVGIALTMGLTVFSLLMMTMLLAWVPPEVFRARLRASGPVQRLQSWVSSRARPQAAAAGVLPLLGGLAAAKPVR